MDWPVARPPHRMAMLGSTRAMVPGDVYEVEIEGIGILRNTVVQGM